MSPSPAAAARLQQKHEDLCAASIRALGADPGVAYRGHRLSLNGQPLNFNAPHLNPVLSGGDFRALRGASDALAMRLLYSDGALYRRQCPGEALPALLFDWLEQLRVESLAPARLPGLARNVRERFMAWASRAAASQVVESEAGIVVYTMALSAWSRLSGRALPEPLEGLLESTRLALAPVIGHDLAALAIHRHEQSSFGLHAAAIATSLSSMIRESAAGPGGQGASEDQRELLRMEPGLLWSQPLMGAPETGPAGPGGGLAQLGAPASGYRVFTRRHDVEVDAATLVRPALLRELRQSLDSAVLGHGINVSRLAARLRRLLAGSRLAGWSFDREEGLLDGSRLARLVSSPGESRLFRQEQTQAHLDCAVTLLVDNSGSMKPHIERVAVLVDVLCRALEQAGARSEALAFSTAAWHGGRCLRAWKAAGQPTSPGRLNELSHRVLKPAQRSWRNAKPGIAAMLRTDLLREGVDGEALEWAWRRLRKRREPLRILVVISDGSPMDSATLAANEEGLLDTHLREVASRIEGSGELLLCALGIGLDLSAWYSNSLMLDMSAELNNQVFSEIPEFLAKSLRRARVARRRG